MVPKKDLKPGIQVLNSIMISLSTCLWKIINCWLHTVFNHDHDWSVVTLVWIDFLSPLSAVFVDVCLLTEEPGVHFHQDNGAQSWERIYILLVNHGIFTTNLNWLYRADIWTINSMLWLKGVDSVANWMFCNDSKPAASSTNTSSLIMKNVC